MDVRTGKPPATPATQPQACHGRTLAVMMDDDDPTGSGSELGSSPSRSMVGHGSDLFKTVLDDYVFEETRISKTEFDRYKMRQQRSDKHDADHVQSRRCDNCQCVFAFCKCEMYHGRMRQFGHRVHWADEVWDKPLTSLLVDPEHEGEHEHVHDHDDVDGHTLGRTEEEENHDKLNHYKTDFHSMPKPILKHRPTCIVIVSDWPRAFTSYLSRLRWMYF